MSAFGELDDGAFEAAAAARGYEIVADDEPGNYEPEPGWQPDPEPVPVQDTGFTDFDERWHHDVDNHLDELNREMTLGLTAQDRNAIKWRIASENLGRRDVETMVFNTARQEQEQLEATSRDTSLPVWKRRNARRERMVRAMDRNQGG